MTTYNSRHLVFLHWQEIGVFAVDVSPGGGGGFSFESVDARPPLLLFILLGRQAFGGLLGVEREVRGGGGGRGGHGVLGLPFSEVQIFWPKVRRDFVELPERLVEESPGSSLEGRPKAAGLGAR